jgi:uncharacterized protein YndB with AHSA1/START domain
MSDAAVPHDRGSEDSPETRAQGRRSYHVQARSDAPVESVWPLLAEARRWKEWTFLTRSELEREGRAEPDGVGAIRHFTRNGIGSREEVLAFDPPTHLAYSILSGFPVRNYRADVTLSPVDGGAQITWSATFDEKVPGTGRLTEMMLRRMIGGFASGLARYAVKTPAS